MKNLEETQREVEELKGELIGVGCFLSALVRSLPPETTRTLMKEFDVELAEAKASLTFSTFSDDLISGLDHYARKWDAIRVG